MNSLQKSLTLSVFLSIFIAFPVSSADIKAGEQKAEHCAGCHGKKGGSGNAQWPNLAAQQPVYIVNQLKAFKSGARSNPVMQSMASHLSDEDINDLAAYFASQPAVKAGGDQALAKSGEAKSAMCLGCHGAKAQGNGQFPRLAGQHSEYLVQQLKAFKQGSRTAGPMQAITANLSDDDIKALAAYFASL
jgi:cytochrome c553